MARLELRFPAHTCELFERITPGKVEQIAERDFIWRVMDDMVVTASLESRRAPLACLFIDPCGCPHANDVLEEMESSSLFNCVAERTPLIGLGLGQSEVSHG